jgi:hypothetical protein
MLMFNKRWAVGLAAGLAALLLSSCGNGNSTTVTAPGTGALYVLISDVPTCDVLSFGLRISSMNIEPQGSDTGIPLISSATLLKLDLSSLRDSTTVLALTTLDAGTYDTINLTLSAPQLGLYDPAEDPPSRVQGLAFSTLAPVVTINPPVTIVKNAVSVLRLDFDMLRSIEVDAQGQITGNGTPVITAFPVTATDEGFGDLRNLVGFVTTLSPSPVGDNFIGSLNLQLLGGSGPIATIFLTADTTLDGVPALNQLETGRFAEVQAFLDPSGNIVARTVKIEDRAVVEENKLAFIGFVNSITRDTGGNLTQFNLHVTEEEPDSGLNIPLNTTVEVNVLPETAFQVSAPDANFADLPFDASNLALGQQVVVHGTYTLNTDTLDTVDAAAVYLRLQMVQGNFSSLTRVESDGRSGAFSMTPCCSLLQGTPMAVITNSNTTFLNVFGLADLRPQPTLLVLGLPFLLPDGATINGVTVPAGSRVVLAQQVHQLQ